VLIFHNYPSPLQPGADSGGVVSVSVPLPCVDLPELVINALDAVIKHAGVDESKDQQVPCGAIVHHFDIHHSLTTLTNCRFSGKKMKRKRASKSRQKQRFGLQTCQCTKTFSVYSHSLLTYSLTHFLTCSLAHLLTYSLANLLTCLRAHLLTPPPSPPVCMHTLLTELLHAGTPRNSFSWITARRSRQTPRTGSAMSRGPRRTSG
jgi:hypothetical protein